MDELPMDGSAIMSACGRYRYRLDRRWGAGTAIAWIMLNPSTADHAVNDHTIRKCIGFTSRLGYGALTVVNLFAFRARDPHVMRAAADPIGPDNDHYVAEVAASGALTLCAWGPQGRHLDRDQHVLEKLRRNGIALHCLHVTADGSPGHPLRLPYGLAPVLL